MVGSESLFPTEREFQDVRKALGEVETSGLGVRAEF